MSADLDACVPCAQLRIARGAVAVQLVRLRVDGRRPALQGLRVVLHGVGVARLLESQVAYQ